MSQPAQVFFLTYIKIVFLISILLKGQYSIHATAQFISLFTDMYKITETIVNMSKYFNGTKSIQYPFIKE